MNGIVRRKVVQHDFYSTAEQVGGVVLLNNPSAGSWEYDEYLRLLVLKRYSWILAQQPPPASKCYFVCADGAYPKLLLYAKEQQQRRPDLRLIGGFPLCDAVIGDMDSYTSCCEQDGCKIPSSAPECGFGTVDDIPVEVLDSIHERAQFATKYFLDANGGVPNAPSGGLGKLHGERPDLFCPLWLHVRCQCTTDFQKALGLLTRLREHHPNENIVVRPPVLYSSCDTNILESGGDVVDSRACGCDNDPAREHALCCEASRCEALLLPTFVALGAFGGRFDHEMGAISTMLSVSHEAHVVLTNAFNTVFACEAGGWTQIVWQPQYEDKTCGLINYGNMVECETSGLLWNVVKGRGRQSATSDFAFGFGHSFRSVTLYAVRLSQSTCGDLRHKRWSPSRMQRYLLLLGVVDWDALRVRLWCFLFFDGKRRRLVD